MCYCRLSPICISAWLLGSTACGGPNSPTPQPTSPRQALDCARRVIENGHFAIVQNDGLDDGLVALRYLPGRTEYLEVTIDSREGQPFRMRSRPWARRAEGDEQAQPNVAAPFADLVADAIAKDCGAAPPDSGAAKATLSVAWQ